MQPGDYQPKALTTVSFANGQTSKTVTVQVRGDTAPEPDETFFLLLSNPVGMTIADGSATGDHRQRRLSVSSTKA